MGLGVLGLDGWMDGDLGGVEMEFLGNWIR